jgi:hypothetical protein
MVIDMVSKSYKNSSTIATTELWVIDPLDHYGGGAGKDYMKKFTPFNSLFAANEDSNTIEIYPNGSQDKKQILPQGSTRNILAADGTLDVFEYVIVKNVGAGTVAVGNITIRIGKEGR